jgi:phosphomannomutase
MPLIKSISGIRGTIGGLAGENLCPPDIVRFSAAFAQLIREDEGLDHPLILLGRDARISGPMISALVCNTLISLGVRVFDLGLSTTPSMEMAVVHHKAQGGIILTASHNPAEWNALKLLNSQGEFISAGKGARLLELSEGVDIQYNTYDTLGEVILVDNFIKEHISAVCAHPLVQSSSIRQRGFRVVVDPVNSVGALSIPALLNALGVDDVVCINCEPNGIFAHNPEPLPSNLLQIGEAVRQHKADLGIVVDPDVDRLAFVCEDGSPFGEEYTLVAVADYVLAHRPGPAVSNLSSSRALRDICRKHGQAYFAAAVGEVNVVSKMKEVNASIGGEGNGGIIDPHLHYGRDALIGTALFLSHLAAKELKASVLRSSYPDYHISKEKIQLTSDMNIDRILEVFASRFNDLEPNTIDGVKIDLEDHWVHVRKSNTEPILRIYVEAGSEELATRYASQWKDELVSCF